MAGDLLAATWADCVIWTHDRCSFWPRLSAAGVSVIRSGNDPCCREKRNAHVCQVATPRLWCLCAYFRGQELFARLKPAAAAETTSLLSDVLGVPQTHSDSRTHQLHCCSPRATWNWMTAWPQSLLDDMLECRILFIQVPNMVDAFFMDLYTHRYIMWNCMWADTFVWL